MVYKSPAAILTRAQDFVEENVTDLPPHQMNACNNMIYVDESVYNYIIKNYINKGTELLNIKF